MSFLNDIIIKLGLPPDNCVGGDCVRIFNGGGVLVEGHKGVLNYTSAQIVVKLKKEKLIVDGENLKIIEVNPSEIYISGKIAGVVRGI